MQLTLEDMDKIRIHNKIASPAAIKFEFNSFKPVSINYIVTLWRSYLENHDLPTIDFYFHTPFCLHNKCKFCLYPSKKIDSMKELDDYLDLIEKQFKVFAPIFKAYKFRNIYLGGGTSSIYNPRQLKRLFSLIFNNFEFQENAQRTFELSFYTATLDKLKIALSYGFNRFTMGIQSWDDEVLEKANRVKPRKHVIQRIIDFLRQKPVLINLDLLYGLPGDSIEKLKNSIERTLEFEPDELTVYEFLVNKVILERNKDDKHYSNYVPPYSFDEVKTLIKEIELDYPQYHFDAQHSENIIIFKKDIPLEEINSYNSQPIWMEHNSIFGNGVFSNSFIENYFWYRIENFENLKQNQFLLFYNNNRNFLKTKYLIDSFSTKHAVYLDDYYKTFNSSFEEDFKDRIELLVKQGKLSKTKGAYLIHFKDTAELTNICLLFLPDEMIKQYL